MKDIGHEATERLLGEVEKKVRKTYSRAVREAQETLQTHLKQFEEDDKKQRKRLDDGELTEKEYGKWRRDNIMKTNQWRDMVDVLSRDLTNADKIAMSIVNGYLPEAYAININYGSYLIERGAGINTSFTLYNREAVERLIRDNPDLLPAPRIDIPKTKRWNKEHISAELTQGILQGEEIPKIAARMQNVVGMSNRAAMRNARTAVTGAESAGRTQAYKRAQDLGIKLKQEWVSAHDGRTRESHLHLDGEQVAVGEMFSNGCRFPGDPQGAPAEVYNCRCTTIPALASLGQIGKASKYAEYNMDKAAHKMSYEEWLKARGANNG